MAFGDWYQISESKGRVVLDRGFGFFWSGSMETYKERVGEIP